MSRGAKTQLEKTCLLLSPPCTSAAPCPQKQGFPLRWRHGKQATVLLEMLSVLQEGWKSELSQQAVVTRAVSYVDLPAHLLVEH